MAENSIFLIDIDKVLKDKAGEKAKKIPRFVVSFLKHIVHQDEVNAFLTRTADKSGVDFLEACMEYLDIKLEVEGIENLPSEGLCTFVSNHPLGGQDGVALGYVLGKHYGGRIKYLVNDLLMNLHGLAPLCIPINKTGSQSRDFPRMANLCKFLGVKFNVAMLFLVDEMYKNRHKTFKVTFGKPIPWQTFNKSRNAAEWADYVRELVYKL